MSRSIFRRRNFLVSRFQNGLLWVTLLHLSLTTVIAIGTFIGTIRSRLDSTTLNVEQRAEISAMMQNLVGELWPAYLLIIAAVVIHSTILSHRVAGPLEKIRSALRRIGEGDFTQHLDLRRTDYLKQDTTVINEMADTLRKRFGTVKEEQVAMELAVAEMGRAIEGGSIGEMRRMHGIMRGRVESLRRELENFHTQPGQNWEPKPQEEAVAREDVPEDVAEPVA